MSENWNEGIDKVVASGSEYMAVLADRRLATRNLLLAVRHLNNLPPHYPFLVFDHQSVWLNAKTIMAGSHHHNIQFYSHQELLDAIGTASVSWRQPMLFNCLIRRAFFKDLYHRYGSYADGVSPDMNFLARVADLSLPEYPLFDSPCIITNARHANLSNGTSLLKHGNILESEHTRLSGVEAYPAYMNNFVTANILGSLARYWNDSRMQEIINPLLLLRSSLLELSYPKSLTAFSEMKTSLLRLIEEWGLGATAKHALENVVHAQASLQRQPIDSSSSMTNSPDLRLLKHIERC
jgi:hypothetical protein